MPRKCRHAQSTIFVVCVMILNDAVMPPAIHAIARGEEDAASTHAPASPGHSAGTVYKAIM